MPYYELPARIIIPDDSEIVYRYLTLEKFKDLINTDTLYFSKAKNFGEYNEGLLSIYDKEDFRKQNILLFKEKWKEKYESEIASYEKFKELTFINCWINSNIESAYMWKEYIKGDDGLAIRTTIKKLKDCLKNTSFKENIFLSKVHYFDPISEPLGLMNTVRLFSRKTFSYRQENEIRAIVQLINFDSIPDNIRVPIATGDLIEEIIFSPKAGKDFRDSVKDLLADTTYAKLLQDSKIKME